MNYRVFARKYRPQRFEEVVGQEHITRTLQNAIRTGRVAQAYLFVGPRGIGKTTTARILAKALNCEQGPTPEPCCRCASCVEIAEGNDMDVIEIDGASNNSVENVREIREKAQYRPARGKFKIYLIDEVHMLTTGAFNALLKILEEPPGHVKFLFATTEAQKVPATILSRCQRFDLRRIPEGAIAKHLLWIAGQEGFELEEAAAEAIARAANGGLRDAESMLDQLVAFCGDRVRVGDVLEVFGLPDAEVIRELAMGVLRGDTPGAMKLVEKEDEAGRDLARVLEQLTKFLRDCLVAQAVGKGAAEHLEAAGLVSREKLIELIEHFSEAEGQLRWAVHKRMNVDVAVIKAVHLVERASLSEVLDTIASLQEGTSGLQGLREVEGLPILAGGEQRREVTKRQGIPRETVATKPFAGASSQNQKNGGREVAQGETEKKGESDSVLQVSEGKQDYATNPRDEQMRIWEEITKRLAERSPLFFGWLTQSVFKVISEGKFVVEVPDSYKDQVEFAVDNYSKIEEEIQKALGNRYTLHVEYLPDAEVKKLQEEEGVGTGEPYPQTEVIENKKETTRDQAETQLKREEILAEERKRILSEFRNDPLIQKAVEIFEAEIINQKTK